LIGASQSRREEAGGKPAFLFLRALADAFDSFSPLRK
jgi:hypothetical protein